MDEAKTIVERAVPFAVRAYPTDKTYFQEICKNFENQQNAFKGVLEVFKNKGSINTPTELESPTIDKLVIELSEANALVEDQKLKIDELAKQLTEANEKLANPHLAELDTNSITAMRKIRPFIIKKGLIKNPDNYKNEFATLAVKFLINTEYSHFLK